MLIHACTCKCMSEQSFSFLPACENMKTMRRVLTGNWQRLAVLQHLPRYQEYLALGDDVCAALSFQDYYTIKFGIQPKDLDEDLLKDIVGGGKKDEHEVQVEIHLESKIHDVQGNEHSSRDSDSHDEKTDYNKFSISVAVTEGLQVEVKNVQAEEKHICCSDSTVSVIEQSESLKTSNEQWADICTEFVTKNSETVLEQNSAIELDCSVVVTEKDGLINHFKSHQK